MKKKMDRDEGGGEKMKLISLSQTCPVGSDSQQMGSQHLAVVPWLYSPSFAREGADAECTHYQPPKMQQI